MKKYRSKIFSVLGGYIASFALLIATLNVNSACTYIAHQPKLPDVAKKLRKF